MSAPDQRATSLLIEHLGYSPIALIDDVINAVNEIMYKCTQAMETYLNEREQKRIEKIKLNKDNDEDVVMADESINMNVLPEDEIELGTAKLETLLESSVDKNFDKFELYALRNILNIPKDLTSGGFVRLIHHKGISFNDSETTSKEIDVRFQVLIKEINFELNIRKILNLQIVKAKKIKKLLLIYKNALKFLNVTDNDQLTSEAVNAYRSISPIDETLYFLLSQVNELFTQVDNLKKKFSNSIEDGGIKNAEFRPSSRESYINEKSYKLLESLGLLEFENLRKIIPNYRTTDVDIEDLKKINTEDLDSVK